MSAASPLKPNGFPDYMRGDFACRPPETNLFAIIAADIPGWLERVEEDPAVAVEALLDFVFTDPDNAQDALAGLIQKAKAYLGDRALFADKEKPSFYAFCDLLFRNMCEPAHIRAANAFFTANEMEDVSLMDQIQSAADVQAFFRRFQWFRDQVVLSRLYDAALFAGLRERKAPTIGKFVWDLVTTRAESFHGWVSKLPRFQASVMDTNTGLIASLKATRDLRGPVLENYPGLSIVIDLLHVHLQEPTKVASLCELLRTAEALWDS